jgi:hypothetical protein
MIDICVSAQQHSLIVARWQKLDRADTAEMFICQHCMRLFEWQELVDRDYYLKGIDDI